MYKLPILLFPLAFSLILHSQNVSTISGIINTYTPVLSLSICTNEITVENASEFNIGDTVLIIQMKGATINLSNTPNFGNITNYNNSGNYSINFIKEINQNVIKLKNILKRQFDIPTGKVQLVRVPYYKSANIISTLTCSPWDGNKGGVLAFNVQDTIYLNANIDISEKGFRGGKIDTHDSPCHELGYFYNTSSPNAGFKGEGIADISDAYAKGRGKIANGGGSGNGANSGAAGGGNYGSGGNGGIEYLCIYTPPQVNNGGIGGSSLKDSITANKIFLGGSGGAGDDNDKVGTSGGNGGGIAIITSDYIVANTFKIISNGESAKSCLGSGCGDGKGGGGAGGSILLAIKRFIDELNILTTGGNGGSLNNPIYHGVGGGGGGGVLLLNSFTLPVNIIHKNDGGLHGFEVNTGEAGGAQNGSIGGASFNINISIDTEPFLGLPVLNITKQNEINCKNKDAQLIATGAIQYSWSPATSLNNPNIPNPIATPSKNTQYTVTGSDINGCINKDTITIFVDNQLPNIKASKSNNIDCKDSFSQLNATGAVDYSWEPISSLNNPNISNPVAAPTLEILYTVTGTASNGCTNKDTISVFVDTQLPKIIASKSNDIDCKNTTSLLNATGGVEYLWLPSSSLNNSNISNPIAKPLETTIYKVIGKGVNGCSNEDSVLVKVEFYNSTEYYVPNAFTPNNDGLNDCFRITNWGTILKFELSIFDRWGQRVFHSMDPSNCWDGNFKGIKQKADVYVYWIRAQTQCTENIFKKGLITLIR